MLIRKLFAITLFGFFSSYSMEQNTILDSATLQAIGKFEPISIPLNQNLQDSDIGYIYVNTFSDDPSNTDLIEDCRMAFWGNIQLYEIADSFFKKLNSVKEAPQVINFFIQQSSELIKAYRGNSDLVGFLYKNEKYPLNEFWKYASAILGLTRK